VSLAALANAGMVFVSHGARGYFLAALACAVCILAALFDGFTGRIPNPLTYTAALVGLGLNGITPLLLRLHAQSASTWLGAPGVKESLLGFAICLILGLAASVMAGIHGGDLKLLAAMGAMLGLSFTAAVVIVGLTVALVYSVINLALMGRLNKIFRMASHRALELAYFRQFHTPVPEPAKASHIPMAIPMALGMLSVLYLLVRNGRTFW
jgi:prepilin peptidase CpaA